MTNRFQNVPWGWIITNGIAIIIFMLLGQMFQIPSVQAWDTAILNMIRQPHTAVIFSLASWITQAGNDVGIIAVLFLGALAAMMTRRFRWGCACWIIATLVNGPLMTVLKNDYHRPRPPFAMSILHHFSYSFPSGHAMQAVCVYGYLAYALSCVFFPQHAGKIIGTVLIWILLIGMSRLVLGVHYPTDIIAGYSEGFLILSLTIGLSKAGYRYWPQLTAFKQSAND